MTASMVMEEKIRKMEDDLKRLRREFEKTLTDDDGFVQVDTDEYLTEVYNG